MRIKTASSLLAGLLIAVTLSGCAFMPNDITELESPPKLTAEQQNIQNALEQAVGNKLTLQYPLEGDYRGAFILTDNNKEAFAFYSSGQSGPQIAVLDKQNGKWTFVKSKSIESEGSEIDSVQFGDYNGDGSDDIAVGWHSGVLFSLCVYLKTGETYKKFKLSTYTKLVTLDITGDGKADIVALDLETDPTKSKARLFSARDGKFVEVSNAPLDSTITKYSGIYATSTKRGGKDDVILIDGFKGSNKMVTEVIYYKNGKLNSPLYRAKTTNPVTRTLRDSDDYKCTDIDKDGVMEIPLLEKLPTVLNKSKSNQVFIANWCDFTGADFTSRMRAVMNYSEKYFFRFPSKWGNRVTVDRRSGDEAWKFCIWDANAGKYGSGLFTIRVYKQSVYTHLPVNKNEQVLAKKGGLVYTVQIAPTKNDGAFTMTLSAIRKNFSLLTN